MKLQVLFLLGFLFFGAAFADDAIIGQNVSERKSCAQLKAEIDQLSEFEYPDEATQATLKKLQSQQRANCLPRATGRRTALHNVAPVPDVATEHPDVLTEYLANKKSNCEKLDAEIKKMMNKNDGSGDSVLASLRGVYDADCLEKPAPKAESGQNIFEKPFEEWSAEYDANLAAGLCGDGTKPNRYGCCTDEVFKDMGNAVFACCPKTGGDCFPPIK